MSEPVGLDGEARNIVSDASASAVYAGQLLRQAREATGLHVAALAVSLKVPVATLDALEAGRIDLLLDLTFARALAASVCRNLKIDPAPVLEHLPPTGASRLGAEAPAINTPFRPPGSGPRLSFRSQMSNPVVLAVAALLIAALAVVFWPKAPEEAVVLATGTEASDTPMAATPAPDDEKLSCPGRSLASAISSFTLWTGRDGCTTSTLSVSATWVIAMKSRAAS